MNENIESVQDINNSQESFFAFPGPSNSPFILIPNNGYIFRLVDQSQNEIDIDSELKLTAEQETEFISYIRTFKDIFSDFNQLDYKVIATQLAVRHNLPLLYNEGMVSDRWISLFLERHSDDIKALFKVVDTKEHDFHMQSFLKLLKKNIQDYKLQKYQLYCFTEMIITFNSERSSIFLANYLKNNCAAMALMMEKGLKTGSVLLCFSASDQYLHPIFSYKKTPIVTLQELEDYAIKDSRITKEEFIDWLMNFAKYSECSIDRPVLLLINGNYPYLKNIDVLDLAKQHGIIFLNLIEPLLLPAITRFTGILNNKYQELSKKISTLIDTESISLLFWKSFNESVREKHSTKAFEEAGLIFSQEDNSVDIVIGSVISLITNKKISKSLLNHQESPTRPMKSLAPKIVEPCQLKISNITSKSFSDINNLNKTLRIPTSNNYLRGANSATVFNMKPNILEKKPKSSRNKRKQTFDFTRDQANHFKKSFDSEENKSKSDLGLKSSDIEVFDEYESSLRKIEIEGSCKCGVCIYCIFNFRNLKENLTSKDPIERTNLPTEKLEPNLIDKNKGRNVNLIKGSKKIIQVEQKIDLETICIDDDDDDDDDEVICLDDISINANDQDIKNRPNVEIVNGILRNKKTQSIPETQFVPTTLSSVLSFHKSLLSMLFSLIRFATNTSADCGTTVRKLVLKLMEEIITGDEFFEKLKSVMNQFSLVLNVAEHEIQSLLPFLHKDLRTMAYSNKQTISEYLNRQDIFFELLEMIFQGELELNNSVKVINKKKQLKFSKNEGITMENHLRWNPAESNANIPDHEIFEVHHKDLCQALKELSNENGEFIHYSVIVYRKVTKESHDDIREYLYTSDSEFYTEYYTETAYNSITSLYQSHTHQLQTYVKPEVLDKICSKKLLIDSNDTDENFARAAFEQAMKYVKNTKTFAIIPKGFGKEGRFTIPWSAIDPSKYYAITPGTNFPLCIISEYGTCQYLRCKEENLPLLNISRQGHARAWMVIPKNAAKVLDKMMRQLCANEVSLFREPGYLLSPVTLDQYGIPYSLFIQNPGDMVYLEPGVFYSIINVGLNVSEYISFVRVLPSDINPDNAGPVGLSQEVVDASDMTNEKEEKKKIFCWIKDCNKKVLYKSLSEHIIMKHKRCDRCLKFKNKSIERIKKHCELCIFKHKCLKCARSFSSKKKLRKHKICIK